MIEKTENQKWLNLRCFSNDFRSFKEASLIVEFFNNNKKKKNIQPVQAYAKI